ncbi:translesion DNA synthesis-associated protein ImuA [Ideonella sp.]|uniref:translesion DNA synthesis-associated protein ImuA n=1 Tax=Ideonella sp. TaxID=1929293 RepID=UPI0035ADCCB8
MGASFSLSSTLPLAFEPPAVPPQRPEQPDWLAEPSRLHPALWRVRGGPAVASGPAADGAVPTGFAALDAELPGGGWPVRVLTELLLPAPGLGEMRLLAPLLQRLAAQGRGVLWFDPPAELHAPALQEMGCAPEACLVVRPPAAPAPPAGRAGRRAPPGAALCWALEQALRSGQAGAVLAWPGAAARPEALRRLQLAAQSHEGPAFLLREWGAAAQSSPAPLRLRLAPAGPDELALHILKRRGPALDTPVHLPLQPVLSERARPRAQRLADAQARAVGAGSRTPGRPGEAQAVPA